MGDSGGFGITQDKRFSSQPLCISGRRLLSADPTTPLPTPGKIVLGAIPTGYTDHGSIVKGLVNIAVDITLDTIDLGRIPSPSRYYIGGQKGNIKANLQEYQPEMVSLAAGGTGTPTVVGSGPTGYTQVYMGGKIGSIRRVLVVEDFDVDFATDGFNWAQFWWHSANSQAGGTFTLTEEKAETVIPIDYNLLVVEINNVNTLLESRMINHS
jgi:hypothetical protein